MARKRTRNRQNLLDIKELQDSAENLSSKVKNQLAYGMQAFGDSSAKVRSYVKENPEKAIMIAVGLGVAIGALGSTFFGKNKDNHK